MPDAPELSFAFAVRGMNGSVDPALLPVNAVARMVNCRLEGQLPRTRYRFRELPVEGDALEVWATSNSQGAIYHNPAKGQGAISFAQDQAQIVEASGGGKFSLSIIGSGGRSRATVRDISGGLKHRADVHLAWLTPAEKFVILGDGISNTWIWDGAYAAFESTGINPADKEQARVPNGISAGVYAHGRLHVVVDGRKIYVGNSLHRENQTEPDDILKFTEQVYWNTGAYFVPPSSMGHIISLDRLSTQNTQHGHSEVFASCEDGTFSVQTNVYPRSSWADQALTKHALLKTGAAGPYAVDSRDPDMVFRSRHGIQTLRSAAATASRMGGQFAPLSNPVATFMQADHEPFLRFTSLIDWTRGGRLFCTVDPHVRGRYRWNRGFIVLNWTPTGDEASEPDGLQSWEGLWTMPPAFGYPVQFVNGIFAGEDRTFVICWNPDQGRKHLVEITTEEGDDVGADGQHYPIACALWTRQSSRDLFAEHSVSTAKIALAGVRGNIRIGLWWRDRGQEAWNCWRIAERTAQDTESPFFRGTPTPAVIPMGRGDVSGLRSIQWLVRWKGVASLEAIRFHRSPAKDTDDSRVECSGTLSPQAPMGYSDYEYPEGFNW